MYTHFFKRIIDFWIALVTLILISPVLLIITILLYVFNEGAGAFFLQERPGLHGRIFKIIKFKTIRMRQANFFRMYSVSPSLVGLSVIHLLTNFRS